MSIYTNMLDDKSATALRLLAKQIEAGEEPEYCLVILDEDDNVVAAHNANRRPYMLIGAVEAEKLAIFDTEID